jgi:hypothetical protein
LVPNLGGGVPVGTPASKSSWANGWEDFAPNYRDNTNILALTGTPFGRYTGNIRIYKCPADIWRAEQRGIDLPRIRSVSMNAYVGNGTNQDTAPGWRVHRKTSDIVSPSPARLWVFTDEHPDSINDGWLVDDPAVIGSWGDLPGSYHNAGDEIGFADGHAEYHQWMDGYNPTTVTGTVQPVTRFTHEGFGDPLKNDTAWWFARTSAGQK